MPDRVAPCRAVSGPCRASLLCCVAMSARHWHILDDWEFGLYFSQMLATGLVLKASQQLRELFKLDLRT